MDLVVNDTLVEPSNFRPTGSWSTWRGLEVTVRLRAGANRIRLSAYGKGPIVDSLMVE